MNRLLLWWLTPFLIVKISHAQQPALPSVAHRSNLPPVYLLNLTPLHGGKTYTLFRKTKVVIHLNNGNEFSGKVRTVSKDSIYLNEKGYAVADIRELRFNPGTTLGAVSAVGACIGIAAIAVTADGGKDGVRSEGENIVFWSGVGLAATGLALSIPNYFIKKKFTRVKYDFRTIQVGGG